MSAPGELTPFGDALREAVEPRDCVALGSVPALLLAVFALPEADRAALRFVYREPTLVTAYTAHFVHFEASHLAANVLGYLLLAGGGYLLAALAGHRRLFGVSAATFLLAFPPVLSALNLAVPRDAVGYGFSGVNMAFAGLLGVVLVLYCSQVSRLVSVPDAPAVFFLGVAVVSVVALPRSALSTGIAVVGGLAGAGYLLSAWRATAGWPSRRLGDLPPGWTDAWVLGGVAFVGYQFVGYPAAVGGDHVVNLYVHLLGFCLGFIVPYAALLSGVLGSPDRGFLSD